MPRNGDTGGGGGGTAGGGGKKTKYTKDIVFYKPKGHTKKGAPLPGVWVPKSEAKEMRYEADKAASIRHAGDASQAAGAAGVFSLAPATAPQTTPPVPGGSAAPGSSWWIGNFYQNPTEEQAFANAANALLPSLSPEDQRNLGNYLATNFADVYSGYSNASFAPVPTTVGDTERNQYLSTQRAQQALDLLDRMQKAAGGASTGSGYDFLKNAVKLITQYSGQGPMTREQYGQFTQAVGAFNDQATSAQKAYANLAQLFNLPNFSAGPLVQNNPNTKLF